VTENGCFIYAVLCYGGMHLNQIRNLPKKPYTKRLSTLFPVPCYRSSEKWLTPRYTIGKPYLGVAEKVFS
jgi:hypothetical protein